MKNVKASVAYVVFGAGLILSAGAQAAGCPQMTQLQSLTSYYKEIKYNVLPQERNVWTRCTYAKKLQGLSNQMISLARSMGSSCRDVMVRDDLTGQEGPIGRVMQSAAPASIRENQARVASECSNQATIEMNQEIERNERSRPKPNKKPQCKQALDYMNALEAQGSDVSAMRENLKKNNCN